MQRALPQWRSEAQLRLLDVLPRAHAPFSQKPVAALILLEDGAWVPGVRVESASYPLILPALLNAYTTMRALERTDPAGIFMSRPFTPEESVLARQILARAPEELSVDDTSMVRERPDTFAAAPLSPFLSGPIPRTPEEGIAQSRTLFDRAYTPESDFQVACLLETDDGMLIPGVNVEHQDWSHILCAERNAVGTVISYGLTTRCTLYLSCARQAGCTPCGACRQLLAELTPLASLWIDQGPNTPPKSYQPHDLLPEMFAGDVLLQRPNSLDAV